MTVLDIAPDVAPVLDRLTAELGRWKVPGLEVAIVRDGEPLYAGGVGLACIEEKRPVGSRTLFHHGSCGKAYTALLAVVVAEEGLLDLDAPVRSYVPELRLPDPFLAERIKVRDLLSHRSGLGRHDVAWIAHPEWSRDELVRRLASLPLAGDLREKFVYSNFAFALAGLVVERVTGTDFVEAMSSRVFDALGMTRSLIETETVRTDPDHAQPYRHDGEELVATAWRLMGAIAPAGGIITCADDAVRWLRAQVGTGGLAAELVARTHQLHTPLPAGFSPFPELSFVGYGMGWLVGAHRGRPSIAHTGGVDGFTTHTLVLPEQRLGVTVSANVFPSQLSWAAALHTIDALLGEVDADSTWFDRLKSLEDGAAGQATEPAADEAAPAAPEPRAAEPAAPTHPLGDYAGRFS
ncbi:MAG: beta-lactamase family protein, partial [Frankiales bacterium]|nr:beta-lactamase family protein [Frankiales bacterium]